MLGLTLELVLYPIDLVKHDGVAERIQPGGPRAVESIDPALLGMGDDLYEEAAVNPCVSSSPYCHQSPADQHPNSAGAHPGRPNRRAARLEHSAAPPVRKQRDLLSTGDDHKAALPQSQDRSCQ